MENTMEIYTQCCSTPQNALKPITAGRLKGMSDINPMYRIQKLTEVFGACGFGWKYTIVNKEIMDGANGEKVAIVDINLYVKWNDEWSEAIPGTGGASFIANERNGAYTSDECVDGECEVLTANGWIKFKDYNGKDEIAQFDKETSEISFTKPTRFIHKVSSDLYDKGGVIMTAHHRNLVQRRSCGDRVVLLAEDFANKKFLPSRNGYGRSKSFRDIKCGLFGTPKQLTIIQRVGIMIACDGTLYRQNSNGDTFWRLEFSKSRKIEKAEMLLKEANIEFKKTINTRKNGSLTTSFVFNLNGDFKDYKTFLPYGNYKGLWNEIISWDGCETCGVQTFCTTNKENAIHMQTLLALSGETVTLTTRERMNAKHHESYVLYKKKHHTGSTGFKKYSGEMDVYCVEVPTTFFLIRKNDEIYVTGNCYKMALTDALSVSCKAIGIGADVYWAAGHTKYDAQRQTAQNRPQQPQTQPLTTTPQPQQNAAQTNVAQPTPRKRLMQLLEARNIDVQQYMAANNLSKETPDAEVIRMIGELEQLPPAPNHVS